MGHEAETRPSARCSVKGMSREVYGRAGFSAVHGAMTRVWLDNGASIHDEVGQHIELRTAESLGPREAVLSVRGMIRAFQELLSTAYPVQLPLKKGEPVPATVHYHAGSYDHRQGDQMGLQRRGFHLSLMAPAPRPDDQIKIHPLLGTYSATASWAGAGMLDGQGFRLLQKDGVTGYNASTSDDKRALVAVHHAQHASNDSVNQGWVRVERRVGDALRSTSAALADDAAASLALRIIEHQRIFSTKAKNELIGSLLVDPTEGLSVVSGDLTLQAVLACLDGQDRTALNIQEILLGHARQVSKEVELPEDEQLGIELWQIFIDTMRRSNPLEADIEEAAMIMHWALRMSYLARKTNKPVTEWSGRDAPLNSRSLSLDLIYPIDPLDPLDPEDPTKSFAERTAIGIMTPQEVADRTHNPPQGTRARARAELVRLHNNRQNKTRVKTISWRQIELHDGRSSTLNPFDPRVPKPLTK